jgi:hypothetical protein
LYIYEFVLYKSSRILYIYPTRPFDARQRRSAPGSAPQRRAQLSPPPLAAMA